MLGRKIATTASGASILPPQPDVPTPSILRSLSNVPIASIGTSHSSCHAVFLSVDGDAYVYGRNESGQCGLPPDASPPLPKQQSESATLTQPAYTGGSSIWCPTKLDRRRHFHPPLQVESTEGDLIQAACGRHHTLLVTRAGDIYAAGLASSGQLGLGPAQVSQGQCNTFRKITKAPFVTQRDPVVQVSCGNQFSLALTASGKSE